jgi:hypothetical protein
MEDTPNFSTFEDNFFEKLDVHALRINAAEAYVVAQAKNANLLAEAEANGVVTSLRYVIREVVDQHKFLSEQVVPANTDRIVIIPNTELDTDTRRLIIRVPVTAAAPAGELFDYFLERVTNEGERQRYLVNEHGVWRYGSAADVDQIATGKFIVRNNPTPENLEGTTRLNRDLGFKPDFDTQTSVGLTF